MEERPLIQRVAANELQVRKQYRLEITNRFAAFENLSDDEDINRAWESIKENIKTLG
jgi:flagellar biosynthesis/type III secretory pathway chaperone